MMGRYAAEKEKKNPFAIFYSPEYRKFQTVVIGVLLAAATQGLLPVAYATWVFLVVGVLTATGVYAVPNGHADTDTFPDEELDEEPDEPLGE